MENFWKYRKTVKEVASGKKTKNNIEGTVHLTCLSFFMHVPDQTSRIKT